LPINSQLTHTGLDMTVEMTARALDVDLLARELGNWRTSSRSGPAYQGLADGIRMLIVDGRLPVGARLPSERALSDVLRVSRTTVTAAYAQLRDDGYLNARRGARSTTA
jgi:DNA-binding GntR family transcriptional regulator